MQPVEFEREVARRLPSVLAELLDDPSPGDLLTLASQDRGTDAQIHAAGRSWAIEIKVSSSPGTVARVAEQLATLPMSDAIPLLVVPFMTPAGAKAASARELNWIDLSGNAHLRDDGLFVSVRGRPNEFPSRGRPSSAFAPKSSRVARAMLLEPERWWAQKDLAERTMLDPGHVSRIVRRLDDDSLLDREGSRLRPRDPGILLDAWAEDYRFDHHDIISGHLSGTGVELARTLEERLEVTHIPHAFTGLPAAWAMTGFARFRLNSVYVTGDPRAAADAVGLRRNERGANVQLIGPDDLGVFDGKQTINDLPCVAPIQLLLDLGHLPERAAEAADMLRSAGSLWHARA